MTRPGTLFRAMAREEYRLHARLFGGRRFAAFPLLVAVLAGVAARALVATGTPFDAVVAGLHALALVFGLQTGTVGLVSTDALDSLLGDVTLLLGSARTLPVTERQLYAVFLVKDVAYYAVLFLAPVALAVGAAGVTAGGDTAALALRAPLLTGTLAATFALGVVGTLALTGLVQRGAAGLVILLVMVAGVALGWSAGVDLVRFTPYAVYRDPTPAGLATGLAALPLAGAAGWLLFDPGGGRPARTARARFAPLADRFPDDRGLVARTLLELHRSGGGVWKVAVSATIIAGAAVALLDLAGRVAGRQPAPAIALGSLLGLTAFTTYNWLTAFDGFETYRALPLTADDVFRAKFVAFLALTPIGGVLYLAGVARFGATPPALGAGLALYLGLSVYLFGLTAYLAGLSPNEFLFDTLLFAVFSGAVAVPLVPVLVTAIALTGPGLGPSGVLAVGGGLLAAVGYGLTRRAGPRWERKLTTG
jgi:hypothetical protein